ncbi:methyltransferase domain-containing protein [Streptomyces sp. NPDC059740]|uniref:methyltransferase domain-containing protein n=1 Tax=Streptomyces sp. NPDC059740 TaxID=3346926 RepID=UPI00366A1415
MRTGAVPARAPGAAYWDTAAAGYDDAPDHGLHDPGVRAAWAERLRTWLPERPCRVLDLGCGTGSLALLAARQGHHVTALDRSPQMVERARAKLAGTTAQLLVADAAAPPLAAGRFDVVLVRHLLWALPDQAAALRRWASLLAPGGRLVLIEGVWGEAATARTGLPLRRLLDLTRPLATHLHTENLAGDARLWGRAVPDERYALLARTADAPPRHSRHREIVDVHLILRRGAEVLLARRAGTGYADGLLHAPSGHHEDGEDVLAAVIRETEEEIGLRLAPEELRAVVVMQHFAPGGEPRVGWFFEAVLDDASDRRPVNREPQKCSELGWYPLADLPEDMVAYCRAGLDAYRSGRRFVLHRHHPDDDIAHDRARPSRAIALDGPGPADHGGK